MAKTILGRKRGMMQRFDEAGDLVVCTVIEAEPNVITQIKSSESDGYRAIQIGFDIVKAGDERTVARRVGKPQMGHFKRADVAPRRHLVEVRVASTDQYSVGQELTVEQFEVGAVVDVTGTSKGRGYQGVMKLHNFSGGPAAHGSGFHRHAGSTGMRSTPGRCLPNSPRASQMGNRQCTTQNLRLVAVDLERNLLLIEGAVPGFQGGLVMVQTAIKSQQNQLAARCA